VPVPVKDLEVLQDDDSVRYPVGVGVVVGVALADLVNGCVAVAEEVDVDVGLAECVVGVADTEREC